MLGAGVPLLLDYFARVRARVGIDFCAEPGRLLVGLELAENASVRVCRVAQSPVKLDQNRRQTGVLRNRRRRPQKTARWRASGFPCALFIDVTGDV